MSYPVLDIKEKVLEKGGHLLTSDYKTRNPERKTHSGMDMIALGNQCDYIVAIADGVISRAEKNNTFGNFVSIKHANGMYSIYMHMKDNTIVVKSGQPIKKGERIGYMGATGQAYGAHLHFGVLNKDDNSTNVDPLPYLKGEKTFNVEPKPTTYTVKEGDTLTSIASKNDTTVDVLVSLNELIKPGQVLKLPVEETIQLGDWVVPTRLVNYNGVSVKQYDDKYKVTALVGDKATCSALRNGQYVIWASMNVKDLKKVE